MGLSEVNDEVSPKRFGDALGVLDGNSAEMREILETNEGDGSGEDNSPFEFSEGIWNFMSFKRS